MRRCILKSKLITWLAHVQSANLTYFSVRRTLFTELSGSVVLRGEPRNNEVDINGEDYNHLWQYLTSRNDKITDDARLAFQSTLNSLIDSLPEESGNNEQEENNENSEHNVQEINH